MYILSKERTNRGYRYLKLYNAYMKGTIGLDIKLSFCDKLKILFSKGLSIVMIGTTGDKR